MSLGLIKSFQSEREENPNRRGFYAGRMLAFFVLNRNSLGLPLEVCYNFSDEPVEDVMKVLVVDDLHINRIVASRILQKGGHTVKAVESGVEAIAALYREDFDLVLMDINMPDMNGMEAARIIRNNISAFRSRKIMILAFTSGTEHTINDFKTAGMNGYIAKPINPRQLMEAIERYSRNRSLFQEDGVTNQDVLVIDDNEMTRDVLILLLEEEGFSVNGCADGMSALDLAKQKLFKVFVVDYRMPRTNGDEVASLLRKLSPESFIIGYSVESKEQEFLSAGADKFILKDRLLAELLPSIRKQ